MNKKTIKFIILILFVGGAFFMVRYMGLGRYLDQRVMREWIEGFGVWGPVIYMLAYSIAPSLMLPGLAITVVGGILFGPFWGVVYVAVGATTGASIAFLVARYMGREWVEGLLKSPRLKEIDREVEEKGWKIVAFTRLIPLFPFNFLNYAFGLTRIRFSHYLMATFVFMFPGIIAYVVFSSSILDIFKGRVSKTFVIGVLLVIFVSLLPILYKRFKGGGHARKV
ncbi:MAG: TVP38/TMEM64 family protein [Thermodesulfobacteriota bacterium]